MGVTHAQICTGLYRFHHGFDLMARCLLMPCAVVVGICNVVLNWAALLWSLASPVMFCFSPWHVAADLWQCAHGFQLWY